MHIFFLLFQKGRKTFFTGKTRRKFPFGFTGKESFPPLLLIEYRGILMARESRKLKAQRID